MIGPVFLPPLLDGSVIVFHGVFREGEINELSPFIDFTSSLKYERSYLRSSSLEIKVYGEVTLS